MIRLHVAVALSAGTEFQVGPDQAHYLVNVMRVGVGETIQVFNGVDGEWRARLLATGRREARLRAETLERPQAPPRDLDLIVALVRRARLETIVEKAAELGAARVRPVMTERTGPAHANLARLRAIAEEAAEQTGRLDVPRVFEPVPLERLLREWPGDRRLLFCDEAGDAAPVLAALAGCAAGPWSILIGPEGGFSAAERAAARATAGALPVSLGPRILRADTAAISAMTIWQASLGDWSA